MAILGNAGLKITGGNDYGLSDPFGDVMGFEKSRKARALGEEATNLYDTLRTPDTESMKLELQGLVEQGKITPEEAKVYLQEQSQMNNISLDPKLQQAQMEALSSLQDISENKGLTAMDRAQLAEIQSQEDTAARGQREAILQNAQQRGLGGSGLEMLSQMQNQQDSATRKAARDTDVAGMAQQRALQALQQAGQLGGNIQQQSFNQQAQVAGANDAINQFNTQAKQQVGLTNTAARNTAQAQNLANQQRIADTNVQTANQQQQYNKELTQKDFENKAQLVQGKAGQMNAQAQQLAGGAAGDKSGLGAVVGAVGQLFSDEKLKKDFEDFDASEFLDSLTPSKYRYKDPGHGEGRRAGVMAQDLERTPEGKSMVEDTPEGKKVDYAQGFSTLLASLVDVHNRLKNVEGK